VKYRAKAFKRDLLPLIEGWYRQKTQNYGMIKTEHMFYSLLAGAFPSV